MCTEMQVWPHEPFPLVAAGKLVLNRNVKNFFAELEQAAFSPAHLVPGIGPSPDRILQGRLFAYSDSQRHRLGPNHMQIPVNCPHKSPVRNYMRDGPMSVEDNGADAPNYFPNSFGGPTHNSMFSAPAFNVSGNASRSEGVSATSNDDVSQVTLFWNKVMGEGERTRLVDNLAAHMSRAKQFVQERGVQMFNQVHPDFGSQLRARLDYYNSMEPKPIKHL